MAVTTNFSQSSLDLNGVVGLSQPTALVWGPDGRLYVTEVDGDVKVLTIAFGDKDPNDADPTAQFYVTDAVTLDEVRSIPNRNDNGTTSNLSDRQVTGIDVTPQYDAAGEPVLINGKPAVTIYVTSSDSRIGAGTSGADQGLDTNSGVITKLTQTGPNSWDAVDLVRGLARSEENHALNGLEVIQTLDADGKLVSERMIVANGGNANSGAPSNNFAGQQEQPYSGAILEVDLDMLATMPVLTDPTSGRAYVYDTPTLDDPTRAGASDAGDPFGGNDGFNSAKLVDGGPVSIYSPGYRNAYDVEVTEDGRVFTYDNGANNTWGGRPVGEAGDNGGTIDFAQVIGYIATNLNNGDGNSNDDINLVNWNPSNKDQMHEVTRSDDLGERALSAGQGGARTYEDPFSGLTLVYGGHPNPTRAEGSRAGLLFSPGAGTDNAFLLVSDQDSFGNGGGSDYEEVVAWLAQVEADDARYPDSGIYGASEGELTSRVLAVTPGVLYDIYALTGGGGAAVVAGGPKPVGGTLLGQAGLPSDIAQIVARTNPIEGDYLEAGRTDGAIDTGNGSINGMAEYTSTLLDEGAVKMSGALISASLGGSLIITGRDADGVMQTSVNGQGFSVAADRTVLSSGGAPLGLAAIGDDVVERGLSLPFQGSIWSAVYKQNGPLIEIFQPANGTVPLAGSEIVDETDADLDGVDYIHDPFEFSADNGYALGAGERMVLDFSPLNDSFPTSFSSTGLLGAALDGVTPNQDAYTAAENFPADQQRPGLYDNAGNILPGGNAPIFQIKKVKDGTVVGAANSARDAMHTGIRPDPDVGRIVATVSIKNWIIETGTPQTGQLTGLMFGDGTQSNFLRVVFGGVEGFGSGIEVGYELGDAGYVVLARDSMTGVTNPFVDSVELRLEISDIGGDFDVRVAYRFEGRSEFTEVPLLGGAGFSLPQGVLRDVLTGDHTITSGGLALPSGAAVGLLAEDTAGDGSNDAGLRAIDFNSLEIEAFGNEIAADTAAEVGASGTGAVDTVIYTGTDTALAPLAGNVENFDGSRSDADYAVTGNALDNTIVVGSGVQHDRHRRGLGQRARHAGAALGRPHHRHEPRRRGAHQRRLGRRPDGELRRGRRARLGRGHGERRVDHLLGRGGGGLRPRRRRRDLRLRGRARRRAPDDAPGADAGGRHQRGRPRRAEQGAARHGDHLRLRRRRRAHVRLQAHGQLEVLLERHLDRDRLPRHRPRRGARLRALLGLHRQVGLRDRRAERHLPGRPDLRRDLPRLRHHRRSERQAPVRRVRRGRARRGRLRHHRRRRRRRHAGDPLLSGRGHRRRAQHRVPQAGRPGQALGPRRVGRERRLRAAHGHDGAHDRLGLGREPAERAGRRARRHRRAERRGRLRPRRARGARRLRTRVLGHRARGGLGAHRGPVGRRHHRHADLRPDAARCGLALGRGRGEPRRGRLRGCRGQRHGGDRQDLHLRAQPRHLRGRPAGARDQRRPRGGRHRRLARRGRQEHLRRRDHGRPDHRGVAAGGRPVLLQPVLEDAVQHRRQGGLHGLEHRARRLGAAHLPRLGGGLVHRDLPDRERPLRGRAVVRRALPRHPQAAAGRLHHQRPGGRAQLRRAHRSGRGRPARQDHQERRRHRRPDRGGRERRHRPAGLQRHRHLRGGAVQPAAHRVGGRRRRRRGRGRDDRLLPRGRPLAAGRRHLLARAGRRRRVGLRRAVLLHRDDPGRGSDRRRRRAHHRRRPGGGPGGVHRHHRRGVGQRPDRRRHSDRDDRGLGRARGRGRLRGCLPGRSVGRSRRPHRPRHAGPRRQRARRDPAGPLRARRARLRLRHLHRGRGPVARSAHPRGLRQRRPDEPGLPGADRGHDHARAAARARPSTRRSRRSSWAAS